MYALQATTRWVTLGTGRQAACPTASTSTCAAGRCRSAHVLLGALIRFDLICCDERARLRCLACVPITEALIPCALALSLSVSFALSVSLALSRSLVRVRRLNALARLHCVSRRRASLRKATTGLGTRCCPTAASLSTRSTRRGGSSSSARTAAAATTTTATGDALSSRLARLGFASAARFFSRFASAPAISRL